MKLRNSFSNDTRALYLGHWKCASCGCNGTTRGGLELHHILGRVSSSPFNSALLCGLCHSGIQHNRKEHRDIFGSSVKFLYITMFKPTDEDMNFLKDNYRELVSYRTQCWFNKL